MKCSKVIMWFFLLIYVEEAIKEKEIASLTTFLRSICWLARFFYIRTPKFRSKLDVLILPECSYKRGSNKKNVYHFIHSC